MTNEELINRLRNVPCWAIGTETEETMLTAADALEADDKRIAELEKELEIWAARSFEGKIGSMALINLNLKMEISKMTAQMQEIKSQIYDLENMAKCEYDDDPDNEYLEGYFDGVHQVARLISTTSTIEKGEQDESCKID